MSNLDYQFFYRRRLPHFQPNGATLFVTFRLHGSIPQSVLFDLQQQKRADERRVGLILDEQIRLKAQYLEQRRYFGRYDTYLDNNLEPMWLANAAVASLVADALHFRDGKLYWLDCFSIMPNHVHMVFTPCDLDNENSVALQKIMHSLKLYTASKANLLLDRTGNPFWQAESYDHVVRDIGEWERIMWYVLNNPVKAGLVDSWTDWPWSYCRYVEE